MEDKNIEVFIADGSGFCKGVNSAIRHTEKVLKNCGEIKVHCAHEIVHNRLVCQRLAKSGLLFLTGDEVPLSGSVVVGSAHGTGPFTRQKYESVGCKFHDFACPIVSRFQKKAREYVLKGYHIIIFGDKNHQEIQSIIEIMNWAIQKELAPGSWEVIRNINEISAEKSQKPVVLMAQTTMSHRKFEDLHHEIYDRYDKVEICDTLCSSVENRVENARELARKVDLMLVVGSQNSNNTKELFDAVSKICRRVILIESAADIYPPTLKGMKKVGLVGGASVDPIDVNQVKSTVENLIV